MKTIISGLTLILLTFSSFADSNELNALKTQYETAVKRAIEPINKVYEQSLKKLLEKASKAGEVDAVSAIAEEMKRLGIEGGNVSSISAPVKVSDLGVNDKLFVGKSWFSSAGYEYRFNKDMTGYRGAPTGVKTPFVWNYVGLNREIIRAVCGNSEPDFFFRFTNKETAEFGRIESKIEDPMMSDKNGFRK